MEPFGGPGVTSQQTTFAWIPYSVFLSRLEFGLSLGKSPRTMAWGETDRPLNSNVEAC
jgi:hypothetical protein